MGVGRVSGRSLVLEGAHSVVSGRGAAHRAGGWPQVRPCARHQLPGGGQRRAPSLFHPHRCEAVHRGLNREPSCGAKPGLRTRPVPVRDAATCRRVHRDFGGGSRCAWRGCDARSPRLPRDAASGAVWTRLAGRGRGSIVARAKRRRAGSPIVPSATYHRDTQEATSLISR